LGNRGSELSIASVTVAYNAMGALPRHLDALSRQTRRLQEVVVVDNASSDGTGELLAERYPHVRVLKMAKNVGMAGAWAAGLAYAALEKNHDWVWTFDDDSIPAEDALEMMLRGKESLNGMQDGVGILAPIPVHGETGTIYPPLLWRQGFKRPSAKMLSTRVWFADLVIASGCMVQRRVVAEVGLPRADFFMDFFDFEYCLRARSRGFKIAVASESRLTHQIGNARQVRLPGYFRLWPNHPPWREYYMTRNLAYAIWWLYPSAVTKLFVLRHLLRHAGGVLLFGSSKISSLQNMVRGFKDGYRGNLGARVIPS